MSFFSREIEPTQLICWLAFALSNLSAETGWGSSGAAVVYPGRSKWSDGSRTRLGGPGETQQDQALSDNEAVSRRAYETLSEQLLLFFSLLN